MLCSRIHFSPSVLLVRDGRTWIELYVHGLCFFARWWGGIGVNHLKENNVSQVAKSSTVYIILDSGPVADLLMQHEFII